MSHLLNHFIHLIQTYGLAGIFTSMVVENIGIPFPTEGAFLVSQGLIATGRYSFFFMYLFIVTSQVVGALIAYGLGRSISEYLTKRLATHKNFQRASETVHAWYKKYGSLTVFITRLVGYVRPWSSLIAGAADFPFWPFLWWTLVGTLIFVYPTMKVTALLLLLWQHSPYSHLFISIGLLVTFFGFLIYVAIRHRGK